MLSYIIVALFRRCIVVTSTFICSPFCLSSISARISSDSSCPNTKKPLLHPQHKISSEFFEFGFVAVPHRRSISAAQRQEMNTAHRRRDGWCAPSGDVGVCGSLQYSTLPKNNQQVAYILCCSEKMNISRASFQGQKFQFSSCYGFFMTRRSEPYKIDSSGSNFVPDFQNY